MKQYPAAPMDGVARLATYVLMGFFAFSVVTQVPLALVLGAPALALPVILGATLLVTWAIAPAGYDIDAARLVIRRHWLKPIVLPLRTVTHVSYRPDSVGWKTVRTFGDGGLFGWVGHFASPELGAFRMYATNRGQAVLVETSGGAGKFVVSPADAPAFESDLANAVTAAEGRLHERSEVRPLPKEQRLSPAFLALPVGLYLAGLWIVLYNLSSLPSRVATHFSLSGTPDGWMSPTAFVVSMAGLGLLLLALAVSLFLWMPKLSASRVGTAITLAAMSFVLLVLDYADADIVWFNRFGLHLFSVDVLVAVTVVAIVALLAATAWWEVRETKY